MSPSRKSFLAIAILFGALGVAHAQTTVAHINVQQLMIEMPDTAAAQAEITKLEQSYQTDLESSTKDLQRLYQQYQEEALTKTEEEMEMRAEDVRQRELNLRQAEQMAGQELQKRQVELFKPIFMKANDAIQKVAKSQGVDYVLDSSEGQGVVFAAGRDLMTDVKKELGF